MVKILIAIIVALQIVHSNCKIEDLPEIDLTEIYESQESMDARPYQQKDCHKNIEEGAYRCRANKPRFRWSVADKTCIKDSYGGCHATKNNFQTFEDCMKVAEPVCKNVK